MDEIQRRVGSNVITTISTTARGQEGFAERTTSEPWKAALMVVMCELSLRHLLAVTKRPERSDEAL